MESSTLTSTPTTPHIHTLCALPPHIAPWGIVISPVIAYLTSPSPTETAETFLESVLRANPTEVDRIFTHPLEAMLDPEILAAEDAPDTVQKSGLTTFNLVQKGSKDWPYEEEYYNFSDFKFPRPDNPDALVRLHRFRSTASPVEGLTANILMHVATIAYARAPVPPIEPLTLD
eukprot:GHVO01070692.1.p1 GENE.GHVO01070692.1~~GHVO01070692.1.p1  ORF type:complete len:174 (+),score=11.39 GHVO01070692.1:614-1135(+)